MRKGAQLTTRGVRAKPDRSHGALFVVGSGVQLDTASRVAKELSRPAKVLNIWSGEVVEVDDVELPGHMAPVTWERLRKVGAAAAQWATENPLGVLVAPQDVGLVFRRAIAKARAKGVLIAFLPDGAVSEGKVTGRSMLGGLVPMADGVLRRVGFVAGRHGQMAASRPDVALSWGPAWNKVFEQQGVADIINVGNPRSDDLASLEAPVPGRVLICSQPMDHAAIGGAAASDAWFAFLERMAASAPAERLRVRLHPAENNKLDSLPLGEKTRSLLTEGTSLSEDIAWSGAIISWASTTMMEAAAASRAVVSLAVNQQAAEFARGYFFLRDPRIVHGLTDDLTTFDELDKLVTQALRDQKGLADDYLVNIGASTKFAAAVLDEL